MRGILLIAHGSRARETESVLESIAQMVKDRMDGVIAEEFAESFTIECAFMEFSDKTVERGVSSLARQNVSEIIVVPYFLFMGIHMKEDIPKIVSECAAIHPNIRITMCEPFEVDGRLADIIADRIKACV